MYDNIKFGFYFPLNSLIHLMHPLAKVICTLIFIIMVFFGFNIFMSVVILLVTFVMMLNARFSFRFYLNIVKKMWIFLLILILVLLLLHLNIFTIISVILNIICLVIYLIIISLTTPITEIVYGFEMFFKPLNRFKFPSQKVALYSDAIISFIPNLLDTANDILKAEAVRGMDYQYANVKGKFIIFINTLFPAIKLTFKKVKVKMKSMFLRNYSAYSVRTNYTVNKWGIFDTYLLVIHLVAFLIMCLRGVGL